MLAKLVQSGRARKGRILFRYPFHKIGKAHIFLDGGGRRRYLDGLGYGRRRRRGLDGRRRRRYLDGLDGGRRRVGHAETCF